MERIVHCHSSVLLAVSVLAVLSAEAGYHTKVSNQPIDYSVKPGVSEADQRAADAELVARLKGTPAEVYAHDILVNRPDYIVAIPKQPLNDRQIDRTKPGDTYNDHFHVIHNPSNGCLYAFWTQATFEDATDQHVAFSRSVDKGRTWTDPVVLAGSYCKARPAFVASWQQPMLAKGGRLYCLWNQQVSGGNTYTGDMLGAYSDDDGRNWSVPQKVPFKFRPDCADQQPDLPAKWCNWQRPLRLGEGGRFLACCSRRGKAAYDRQEMSCTEFWQYDNIDDNPQVKDIRLSFFNVNRDAFKVDDEMAKSFTPAGNEGHVMQEASIVRLPDGRLFTIMRSSVGHPFWSQSRDRGRTWDRPKVLCGEDGKPFLHPRSPCPMYDLKGETAGSGLYFALIHNAFDFKSKTAMQPRGPLYLIAGRFDPKGEQPVRFSKPRLFAPRRVGNSFYASHTVIDGQGVLWFNDDKFFLLGRKVGMEWFR